MARMWSHRQSLIPLVAGVLAIPPWAFAAPEASRTTAAHGASLAGATRPVLPWIEDSYPRAVAEAKARQLPIFVESWAPW